MIADTIGNRSIQRVAQIVLEKKLGRVQVIGIILRRYLVGGSRLRTLRDTHPFKGIRLRKRGHARHDCYVFLGSVEDPACLVVAQLSINQIATVYRHENVRQHIQIGIAIDQLGAIIRHERVDGEQASIVFGIGRVIQPIVVTGCTAQPLQCRQTVSRLRATRPSAPPDRNTAAAPAATATCHSDSQSHHCRHSRLALQNVHFQPPFTASQRLRCTHKLVGQRMQRG